jgi:glycosyltransferase involved in cell wall biosynthesis
MLVSVIIPNYNHSRFLSRRFESVLNQDFGDFEVIILDDASQDDSRDIIESQRNNPRVKRILYNTTNSGNTFVQWERGIKEASGKYIWIAESDDISDEKFLETAITALEKNNGMLFFSSSIIIDESNNYITKSFDWTNDITGLDWENGFCISGREFTGKALSKKNAILNTSSVVFKQQSFDFSNIILYKTCGDWLFWINMLRNTESPVIFSPLPLNFFRTHAATTRNFDSAEKLSRKLMEELSVRYLLYKKGFLKRNLFFKNFRYTADCLMKTSERFKILSHELKLPFFFARHFFIRRCQLVLLKLLRPVKASVNR